jgi:UPF0176 protein
LRLNEILPVPLLFTNGKQQVGVHPASDLKVSTMAVLHNRISQKELKQRLLEETEPRTTISFYQYFHIDEPKLFRDQLYKQLNELKVFGRIYLAHEGINAQISVPQSSFQNLRDYLYSIEPLNGIRLNIAVMTANLSGF